MNESKPDSLPFVELANKLGFNFSPNKNNPCPACKKKSSFSVFNNNTMYKCFNPGCDLNKAGNIFNFGVAMGLYTTYGDVARALNLRGGGSKVSSRRARVLAKAFDVYKDCYQEYPDAKAYVEQRWGALPPSVEIGYAPADGILIEALPDYIKDLQRELLINEDVEMIRNRLVFPIRDMQGNLVHLHSRSLDPDSTLRWMATKTNGCDPNTRYIWQGYRQRGARSLIMTEGISDGLSLAVLGLPTIATLSIQSDLASMIKPFKNLRQLLCIFDNDKHALGTGRHAGLYKSWEHTLPNLINLQILRPDISIFCMYPPNVPGVKDINEWVNKCFINVELFNAYCNKHAKSLTEFALDYYIDRVDKHRDLIRLMAHNPEQKAALASWVESRYDSWIDYCITVLGETKL